MLKLTTTWRFSVPWSDKVDELVQPVRGTGGQTSHPGDRTVRVELRKILRDSGLPHQGELFDHAYEYIRENY